jgi:hypothetical protein
MRADAAVQRADGSITLLDTATGEQAPLAPAVDQGIAHQATPGLHVVAWAASTPVGDGLDHAVVTASLPPHGSPADVAAHPIVFGAFYLAWRPDGAVVAALGNGPLGLELTTIDVAAATQHIAARGGPLFFDWSVDGRLVAHIGPPGEDRIVVLGATEHASNGPTCPSPAGVFTAPAWHPDGERVLVALRDDTLAWWWPDLSTTAAIAPAPGPVRFGLAPSGERAWCCASNGPLMVMEGGTFLGATAMHPSEVEVLSHPPVAAWWSPSGHELLILDAGMADGTPRVRHLVWRNGEVVHLGGWYTPTAADGRHHLPFPEQYARSHTPWLADGSGFVWAGVTIDGVEGVRRERIGEAPQWCCPGERVIALR